MPKRAIPPPLTERQAALLEYIIAHVEQHGRQPLLRETAAHFGVSPSAVISYLRALQSKGKVLTGTAFISSSGDGRSRCCTLLPSCSLFESPDTRKLAA